MRTILFAGIAMFALGGTAVAQMCGAPQQSGSTAQAGGMSCMGMPSAQADDPMADKPAEKPMATGMSCPCCKNMAMMSGMKQSDAPPKHESPKH